MKLEQLKAMTPDERRTMLEMLGAAQSVFKSGRQFAAFLGLVPRQNSSGGKDRLGHISKMGNGYLRCLQVIGANSVKRRAETTNTRTGAWVRSLLVRKTDQARHRCHCQQDGTRRQGHADTPRRLQSLSNA